MNSILKTKNYEMVEKRINTSLDKLFYLLYCYLISTLNSEELVVVGSLKSPRCSQLFYFLGKDYFFLSMMSQ